MDNEITDTKDLSGIIDRMDHQAHSIRDSKDDDEIYSRLSEGQVLFDNVSEGVLITDSHYIILKVNTSFSAITGFSADEAIGKTPSILRSNRHDTRFYRELKSSLDQFGRWQGEIWNRRKNGEIYPEILTIIALYDKNNEIHRYAGFFTDITCYINKNVHIRNHAYYDTLTGLPNRMLLNDRLSFMLNHAKRKNQIMALLLLDLNRFKLINDTLGYTIGDLLLQTVSNRLKSCLREVDAVFRLGDDEFAIILEEIAQTQDAARVAKRILTVCSLPFQLNNHELYITLSIGISIFPSDGEDLEVILKNAEAAMHRAKELGINNYQHYKPTMNAKAFEQLTLEHNLRKALRQDEFVVYYQPVIDLKTGEITGSEALVRWKHPDLGMISPAQFIPMAEETGLILPIGEWVLRTATHQARIWHDIFGKPLTIAVNLSARQFQQQDLVTTVNKALVEADLQPECLELEITESLGMKNPELTLRTLQELNSMGIKIAIDDFGTGYSSLSYLKKFPINTIKIDRSFVSDLQKDCNDAAIILAIIAVAHSMKLKVIAEGVETKEQAGFLLDQGCEKVQGFIYSPPISAENFEKLILKSPLQF